MIKLTCVLRTGSLILLQPSVLPQASQMREPGRTGGQRDVNRRKWKEWGRQNRIIMDPISIEAWILDKSYKLQQQPPPRSLSPLFSISHLLFFPLSIPFLTHRSNAPLYHPSSSLIHTSSPLGPFTSLIINLFLPLSVVSLSLYSLLAICYQLSFFLIHIHDRKLKENPSFLFDANVQLLS